MINHELYFWISQAGSINGTMNALQGIGYQSRNKFTPKGLGEIALRS
jgi:hypothetical protein